MLTQISSATLRKMVKLSERKEALMSEIQKIDREMLRLQEQETAGMSQPTKRSAGRRSSRGALRQNILSALESAGKQGATVRELSEKLGVKTANLYVWFNGTGKNVERIKKIGPATYRVLD